MRDYEELVERLRSHNGWALNKTLDEAADAIEELQAELVTMRNQLPKWISVEDENGQV